MPRPPRQKGADRETLIQQALQGIATGLYKSVYHASAQLGIPKATLSRRNAGHQGRTQAREEQQLLSQPEEHALAKWLTHLTASGFPARHAILRDMAEEIRKDRISKINDHSIILVSYPPIGKNWVHRFLGRHPKLQTAITRSIEAARIKEVTRDAINNWFDIFAATLEDYQITMENVYNMDETGFPIGTIQTARVIVDTTIRMKYQAQPGRQEWVTAVECVCADGNSIPPLIIFKGESMLNAWIPRDIEPRWSFSSNTKGWTSNAHGLEWLRKCFEPATRGKANERMRMLICDGHDSHISADFIYHCIQNDIVLFLLPPHSSHLMQPLDVGVFGPLKTAISAQLARLLSTGIPQLQKIEWLENYVPAWARALTTQNIEGGWRGAGIFPTNRMKVLRNLPRAPATPPPVHIILPCNLICSF